MRFDEDEHQLSDDLKSQFEAVYLSPDEEKKIGTAPLEGMILKHEAKHLATGKKKGSCLKSESEMKT